MKKLLLIVLAMYSISLYAQNNESKKRIKIGDNVPNIKFTNMVNYPAKELNLVDLKHRLVILDYWVKS